MDYAFFENLTPAEARAYLERFLDVESREIERSVADARAAGVAADFSIESVPAFFIWLGPMAGMHQVPPPDMPGWLVESMETHHGGFRNFDDDARPLVLRASYYLGESFVRSFPKLSWALGRAGQAQFQQPVITGFRAETDLAPLVVAENMLRLADRPEYLKRLQTAVAGWRAAAGTK